MRVKMTSIYAGPAGTASPGGILDVSPKEAKGLVDGGYGAYADPAGKPAADGKTKAKTKAQREAHDKAVTEATALVATARANVNTAQLAWERAEAGDTKASALIALDEAKADQAAAEETLADLKAA